MRISELSTASGISVATIKYYTREGILPPGRRLGHNQTDYDDTHVARLRLIRALLDQGGLSIAAVRGVLAATDNPDVPVVRAMGAAHQALPVPPVQPSEEALRRVRELAAGRGWQMSHTNPGIVIAAAALDAFQATGRADLGSSIGTFADAMDLVAASDVAAVNTAGTRDRMAETTIIGTLVGDRLLAGLRLMAQEARFRAAHPGAPLPDPDACAGDCADTCPDDAAAPAGPPQDESVG